MALPASILGINIPSLPFGAPYCALSDGGSVPSISPLALVSPAGTFLAAIAALVSVYMIVVDEVPPVIWIIGDRLLVDVRRSAATRRRYSGTPCTIHQRHWLNPAGRRDGLLAFARVVNL